MATLSKTESRRLYSWWWDSHISPKNSKWLKENLSDMDMKVKAMIKLIEEDADSFARRAEMYYKKRPELIKLVEEFYRAYRALAERYDHATGALRQAHQTMAEAFPNQIPFSVNDDPKSAPSPLKQEQNTPKGMPFGTYFDLDELREDDAMVVSPGFHAMKRNGAYTDEHNSLSGKNGLKQLNQMFGTGEVAARSMFAEGRVRKGLKFQEEERKVSRHKVRNSPRDISDEIRCLQEEISQLSKENRDLDNQITSESRRADEAETEVGTLKQTLSKLNSEKEDAFSQYQLSLKKLSNLEAEIFRTQEECRKLDKEMLMGVEKINSVEDRSLLLEKENQSLQLEMDTLKQRHHDLTKEMEAIGFHVELLQASLKELENEKLELQEICRKCQAEKQHLLDAQKNLENVLEKNVLLENSLSDVHAEAETLREKIKALEDADESLREQISVNISEKAELASRIWALSHSMEKLFENNSSLEASLSDTNDELEGLRQKLKGLEESFQSLNDQYYTLTTEKDTLLLQIENMGQQLKDLEQRHAELQEKYLILEGEKETSLHQVVELQVFLKLEKQEYKNLIQSSKNQQAKLDIQIHQLQQEGRLREEKSEIEQLKFMNSQTENFILQQFLHEMKESNLAFSRECQKHLETLRCSENQKSELEHDYLVQKQTVSSLLEHNEKLREGIRNILKVHTTYNEHFFVEDTSDKFLIQHVVSESSDLLSSLSRFQDEIQCLILDKLVVITFLKQFGRDALDMRLEKDVLQRELNTRNEELSQIKRKQYELMELNEHLTRDVQAGNDKQVILNAEVRHVCAQLSNLKEAHNILKDEKLKLLEKYRTLFVKFTNLKEIKDTMDEESSLILSEVISLECLYSIFKSISIESVSELQSLKIELASLHRNKNELDLEIRELHEKIEMTEQENMHLKDSAVTLDEYRSRLMILEDNFQGARDVIYSLSKDGAHKDQEVASLREANEMLNEKLENLQKYVEKLKLKEQYLASELESSINEIKYCEVEMVALLDELQSSVTNAALFEEKVLDLIMVCETLETSAMVQREMLNNALSVRDVYQDGLKGKLNDLEEENKDLKTGIHACMPLVKSVCASIAMLEESILHLAKHCASNFLEKQDKLLMFHNHDKGNPEEIKEHHANAQVGVQELQNLHARIEALRELVIDTTNHLEEEKLHSNAILEAERKETRQEAEAKRNTIQVEEGEMSGIYQKLQPDDDAETSANNDIHMMKDVELDHVSSSSPYENDVGSYEPAAIEVAVIDDQRHEPLQTSERVCSNQVGSITSPSMEHNIQYHEIKEVEEQKSKYPSSLDAENDLGIDLLESPKNVSGSRQEWSGRIIERLAFDAERLLMLQTSVEELKGQTEASEKSKYHATVEFDAIKTQLKEAEGTISELIDINMELKKKAEDYSSSSDSKVGTQKIFGDKSNRQISVSARRGSEKIGRLELELQKIQYVLLKLKEEHENRSRAVGRRRRRVMLKDYLYGRESSRIPKKSHLCGCMRSNTHSD